MCKLAIEGHFSIGCPLFGLRRDKNKKTAHKQSSLRICVHVGTSKYLIG